MPERPRAGVLAVFEAIALAVELQDVDVVGQLVEPRARQPCGAEDLGPFVEGQIRGHQRGRLRDSYGVGVVFSLNTGFTEVLAAVQQKLPGLPGALSG